MRFEWGQNSFYRSLGFAFGGQPRRLSLRELLQEIGKNLLALGEGPVHLAADKGGVGDCAEKAEADFVFDLIEDQRAGNTVAVFGHEFVAVMPALELAFVLHVGEVMVPFEFGNARDPGRAQRQKREDAK